LAVLLLHDVLPSKMDFIIESRGALEDRDEAEEQPVKAPSGRGHQQILQVVPKLGETFSSTSTVLCRLETFPLFIHTGNNTFRRAVANTASAAAAHRDEQKKCHQY
jgi:hypothetical protein